MKDSQKAASVIVLLATCTLSVNSQNLDEQNAAQHDSVSPFESGDETTSSFMTAFRSKRRRRFLGGGLFRKIIGGRPVSIAHLLTGDIKNHAIDTKNATDTQRHAPWQAGIRLMDRGTDNYEAHCGGTIISKFWILSAAHCFGSTQNVAYYKVRVGDIDNMREEEGEQEFDVAKIRLHPSFNNCANDACDYDLAYVRIKPKNGRGIQYNYNVQRAYLPGSYNVIPQEDCYISGWGRTTNKRWDVGTNMLQIARVRLFNQTGQEECARAYGANLVTDRMLCAGYLDGTKVDACAGDSGGPLVCKIQGKYVLVGITSWGANECAKEGKPGIYANVKTIMSS